MRSGIKIKDGIIREESAPAVNGKVNFQKTLVLFIIMVLNMLLAI